MRYYYNINWTKNGKVSLFKSNAYSCNTFDGTVESGKKFLIFAFGRDSNKEALEDALLLVLSMDSKLFKCSKNLSEYSKSSYDPNFFVIVLKGITSTSADNALYQLLKYSDKLK